MEAAGGEEDKRWMARSLNGYGSLMCPGDGG